MSASDIFTLELTDNAIKIFDGEVRQKDILAKKISIYDNLPFSFFTQDLPDLSQKLADIIKKLVSDLKIGKRKVNLIIPDSYTYSQIIPMPALNEKELISAIKYQADQFIPLPIEEINIDLEIIHHNEKEKKLLVLVAAVSKKLAQKIEEAIEFAGLYPVVLENQLSAFSRFVNHFSSSFSQNSSSKIIFVNLGQNSTSLYFFDQSTFLISKVHNFNLGYNLFFKELQITTSLDDKKTNELLSSFNLKNQGNIDVETMISPITKQFIFEIKKIVTPPASAFFIGDIVLFPALTEIINKNIDLPISFTIFNPYSLFKPNPQIDYYKDKLSFLVSTIGGQIE